MEEFIPMIAAALKLPAHRVENTLKLLQGGATIPFISRYRKEATGGLDEVQIGEINTRYEKFCELAKRKETILSTIEVAAIAADKLKPSIIPKEVMFAFIVKSLTNNFFQIYDKNRRD